MRRFIITTFFIFSAAGGFLNAQKLYMPRNITNAVNAGTRSLDGYPGKNYWQNKGRYDINVTVTPETKIVSGNERIVYSNNSPDTLHHIAIRFVNNINKLPVVCDTSIANGLTIYSFSINNEPYRVDSKNWGTVTAVKLKRPVLPKSSVELTISWSYPLLKKHGREGEIDSTTFYVAYSYPRVSVYDDYNGWDMLPHTGGQEFYNDFNDYQLSVKAPKDYVVWATGDLLNPDEVLQPLIVSRLKASYTSDTVSHIATFDEMREHKVTAQNDWNTWKFTANHITDVCFALSKNYVWDASSIVADPITQRRVSVQAAYNDTAKDFHHHAEWARHSLSFFSNKWPGVPYPYSKMTSFQGYADMEYPMMVNDATSSDLKFSRMVLDHEMAHTYFPFYMGINETRYAYMDEGWATTFEYLIGIETFGKEYADSLYKAFRIRSWITDPSTEEDQPIISLSTQVNGVGYGRNSYGKASLSYLALKDLLGDKVFKAALHHYMKVWNGKHPIPWDYFNAMNTGSRQNLNWFFNNWFFTNSYIDLRIDTVIKQSDSYVINITNVGGFAIPFDLKIGYADGKTSSIHITPSVWRKSPKSQTFKISNKMEIRSIHLDGGIFMDYTPGDNFWNK